jgi:NDP-sugar pyrophosphorylase family protein
MSGSAATTNPTVILLAGGQGTRLRTVDASRPKPMVLVRGKPFLHWLVEHLRRQGFCDYILSTGHMADVIEGYRWSSEIAHTTFRVHREISPLGTGGATQGIFRAFPGLKSAWVVNGDTLLSEALPAPPAEAEAFYTTLTAEQVFDAAPNLVVDEDCVIAESPSGQYFDAGAVWVTRRAVERYTGALPCSLHRLLSPSMAGRRVRCGSIGGTCYDIGTPARLRRFEAYLGTIRA